MIHPVIVLLIIAVGGITHNIDHNWLILYSLICIMWCDIHELMLELKIRRKKKDGTNVDSKGRKI